MIQYLAGLSRRERWLLALLVLVALPVGAFYGVALPLSQERNAARLEVADARAIEAWVADQSAVFLAQKQNIGQADVPQGAPIGISGIEKSLVEVGLRKGVSELANNGEGGITLRFDTVRFTAISEWLSTTGQGWGYDLTSFTFERGEKQDFVKAELRLVPTQ